MLFPYFSAVENSLLNRNQSHLSPSQVRFDYLGIKYRKVISAAKILAVVLMKVVTNVYRILSVALLAIIANSAIQSSTWTLFTLLFCS